MAGKKDAFEIIKRLDDHFEKYRKQYEEHKQRVIKAIAWWNENVIIPNGDNFVGSTVKVNGVDCMCMLNDLTGIPFFMTEFKVRPLRMEQDAGSGAGNQHTVSF